MEQMNTLVALERVEDGKLSLIPWWRMNHKLASGVKIWKGYCNTIPKGLWIVIECYIVHQEGRGQMIVIMMRHIIIHWSLKVKIILIFNQGSLASLKISRFWIQSLKFPQHLGSIFFASWKNPMTSAGSKPANLVPWGEHVTPEIPEIIWKWR